MIALIDNYDSFTYNLYQYLSQYGEVKVYKNDEIDSKKLLKVGVKGIVISPGPGSPKDAGNSIEIIRELGEKIPILGICLGHQAIAEVFGGKLIKSNKIFHGKTSKVQLRGNDIFQGVSRRIEAMRYHSLIVERESLPSSLEVIAETVDNEVIMAIKHRKYEIYGIQFHPESIYTPKGMRIIRNFVEEICNEYRSCN